MGNYCLLVACVCVRSFLSLLNKWIILNQSWKHVQTMQSVQIMIINCLSTWNAKHLQDEEGREMQRWREKDRAGESVFDKAKKKTKKKII